MSNSLKLFLENQLEFFNQHKRVAVFGAGSGGQQVIEWLRKSNITVCRVYDNDPTKHGIPVCGVEVFTPNKQIINDYPVVIASTWNKEIKQQLSELACTLFIDASITGLSNTPITSDWLTQLKWLEEQLVDDDSKLVLEDIAHYLEQPEKGMPKAKYEQYQHPKLHLIKNATIIDGGAFDALSSINLHHHYGLETKVTAFEPDPGNVLKCKQLIANYEHKEKISLIEKGVWDKEETLYFNSSNSVHGASSSANSQGDIQVPVTGIDIALKGHKVHMIKLDVEGAELKALQGAKKTILSDKPILAICLYHYFDDLWILPKYIKELNPKYRFYIGHHTNNWFETVLYAI
ncbi:hypothetical protein TUM4438_35710 [Shewanella sairae]|uniref:Methyltransferase FkbM domain-containing protein n=1 Tax=Shewanella sairae TaxID=190310 RepID=A0ABQ4PNZ1_9GAMM|nr:FkbM family methyltransferase [Shewanella sairae]MCL1129261.1 FkbM family methyltransferase [Shewanella sairae]GIU50279.1 hypothetical protein TUM4438_35710 [Shewanella sairae]